MLLKKEASKSQSPSSDAVFFFSHATETVKGKVKKKKHPQTSFPYIQRRSSPALCLMETLGHLFEDENEDKAVISSHSFWAVAPSSHYKKSLKHRGDDSRHRDRPIYSETPPHHLLMPVQ